MIDCLQDQPTIESLAVYLLVQARLSVDSDPLMHDKIRIEEFHIDIDKIIIRANGRLFHLNCEPQVIDSFDGKYEFLSNFSDSIIDYNGVVYPTVEHAYQAAKSLVIEQRIRISQLKTPNAAKRVGRSIKLRSDWEDVKISIMTDLVRLKFVNAKLRKKLLMTGNKKLIEGNTWKDDFWGVYRGKGQNHLGQILMKVREEIFNG